MKKIISLSLIVLMIMGLMNFAQANSSNLYNITLSHTNRELEENETFIVNVIISNIQAEKGILTLEARLKYDKNVLEIEGNEQGISNAGKWTDISYNRSNGKLVTDRNDGYATATETIFSIKFRVKETTEESTTIYLNDIIASNNIDDLTTKNVSTTIKIKSKKNEVIPPIEEQKPEEKPNPTEPTKPDENISQPGGDINQGGNTKPEDNTPTDTKPNANSSANAGVNTNANPGTSPNVNSNAGVSSSTTSNNNTGANSNKKPVVNSNTKPAVNNNNTNQEPNNDDNANQEEMAGIIEENTINEDNTINENLVDNNITPIIASTKKVNNDNDFNYPLLIGGTLIIILLEIGITLIKGKQKIAKLNNEIIENDYDNIMENSNEEIIENNYNNTNQDNENKTIDNTWGDIGFNVGHNTAYNNYSSIISDDDSILKNYYNNRRYNHYDDIK